MTNSGPVPFVPWGTTRGSREEVKTKHIEKALTFHEAIGSRGKRLGQLKQGDLIKNQEADAPY